MIDVKKLQDPKIQEQFAIAVENKFEVLARLDHPNSPDELWNDLKDVLLELPMKFHQEEKRVGYLKRPSNCVKEKRKPKSTTHRVIKN